MDRLDRTLERFVQEGDLQPGVAADISREFHTRHIDVRARLAELVGYAGATLAVIGIVVLGSQMWSDIGQWARVVIPAVMSAGLLLLARHVAHSVPAEGGHTGRVRLAQVLGLCAAILASIAVALVFNVTQTSEPLQPLLAFATGMLIVFIVSRWVPGLIPTLAFAAYTYATAVALLGALPIGDGGPGPFGAISVALGVAGATIVYRFFPPDWLMRLLGIGSWLMGTLMLIMSPEEYELQGSSRAYWMWLGRISAVALVIAGTWVFARGGDWPWAVGAALAAAMLVGLWSAQALNAGIALVVAGLVLIAVGTGLAAGRRASRRPTHHEVPAKMGS